MGNDTIQEHWMDLDVDELCRNWEPDEDGTQVAMMNRVAALHALSGAVNHLLHRTPRTVFNHFSTLAADEDDTTDSTSEPYLAWTYRDYLDNEMEFVYRALTSGYVTDPLSNDTYFRRASMNNSTGAWTGDSATESARHRGRVGHAGYPINIGQSEALYLRGNSAADAEVYEGLGTIENYIVNDLVVQSNVYDEHDRTRHAVYVEGGGISPGYDIMLNYIEDIRSKFHTFRKESTSTFCSWSAVGNSDTWSATPDPGINNVGRTRRGIWCREATNWTNILDGTESSGGDHTSSTAGFSSHVRYSGRGNETKTAGKKVAAACRVFAVNNHATADAYVKFWGPTNINGTNRIDITVPANNTTPLWYGDDDDIVYLNASIADTETSGDRNKIDVYVKSDSTDSANLQLFGVHVEERYE